MLKTPLRKYLSTKDTEYEIGLPTDVRRIQYRVPTNTSVQVSFTQGVVGTDTFEGDVVFDTHDTGMLRFTPSKLYVAAAHAGTILDVDIWHGE